MTRPTDVPALPSAAGGEVAPHGDRPYPRFMLTYPEVPETAEAANASSPPSEARTDEEHRAASDSEAGAADNRAVDDCPITEVETTVAKRTGPLVLAESTGGGQRAISARVGDRVRPYVLQKTDNGPQPKQDLEPIRGEATAMSGGGVGHAKSPSDDSSTQGGEVEPRRDDYPDKDGSAPQPLPATEKAIGTASVPYDARHREKDAPQQADTGPHTDAGDMQPYRSEPEADPDLLPPRYDRLYVQLVQRGETITTGNDRPSAVDGLPRGDERFAELQAKTNDVLTVVGRVTAEYLGGVQFVVDGEGVFVPAEPEDILACYMAVNPQPGQISLDIGHGDGRWVDVGGIVLGLNAYGCELSPQRLEISRAALQTLVDEEVATPLEAAKVHLLQGNFFDERIDNISIFTFYAGSGPVTRRVTEKLLAEAKPGAKLIVYGPRDDPYHFEGLEFVTYNVPGSRLPVAIYRVPERSYHQPPLY